MKRTDILRLNKRRFLQPAKPEYEHPIYTLIAVLVTMFFLVTVYAILQASPFGDRQIFQIDQFHQYSPFMAELRRKMLGGESVLYSWNGGLGYNFWSSLGYYLASPFNLFLLFFPEAHLADAVLFLTVLKISLTAGAMQLFLSRSFRRGPMVAIGFGTAYALSTFVMAYAWNIMWLDVLLFLPLAALGLVRLIQKRGRVLYIVSLALMIWSNFYLAGFACAFLAFFYPVLWLRFTPRPRRTRFKDIALGFLDFVLSSLLAGALTAILLIPTVLNLGLTSAADDQPPTVISFFHDAILILGRAYPFNKPAVMSGLPNIYIGLASVLLLPVYLGSKRIPRGAKVTAIVLLGFIFLSFNNNWLNFAWHAFHYPNSLNHRFAFVFSFLLIFMAFDALVHAKHVRPGQLGTTAGIVLLLAFVMQMTDSTEETAQLGHNALIVTAIALGLLVWALGRYLQKRREVDREHIARERLKDGRRPRNDRRMAIIALPLTLVMVAEAGANMFFAHYDRSQNSGFGPKDGYAAGVLPDELRDVAAQIEADHPGQLVRSEVVPPLTTNDGAIYDLHGLSIFASTYPEAPIKFFRELGYRTNGVNSIAYRGSNVMMDNILGIRYVINKDKTWYPVTPFRTMINSQTRIDVYENHDALGLGLFTAEDPRNLVVSGVDAFTAQNLFVMALGGASTLMVRVPEVEQYVTVDPLTGHAAETVTDPGGRFSISGTEENFRVAVTEAGYYSAGWSSSDASINRVAVVSRGGDETIASHRDGMQELGYYEAGEEILLRFIQSEERSATLNLHVARIDQQAYYSTMQTFHSSQMLMTDLDDSGFSGTVTAPTDGFMFFAVPYDPGWTFRVDGRETQVHSVDGALMAIEMPAGEHEIEADFVPRGFMEGVVISLIGLAAFIGVLWLAKQKRRTAHSMLRIRRIKVPPAESIEGFRERFFPPKNSTQLTEGVRSAPPIVIE